jgi:hypothetical protein
MKGIKKVVVEPVEIFTIHSTYGQLSKGDKRRMIGALIRWAIKEWFKNL